MILGRCPVCSKKIGRTTANGFFFYDWKKAQQILMHYDYTGPDHKACSSIVVVMMCKDCYEDSEHEGVHEGLMKKDQALRQFIKEFPDAHCTSSEADPLTPDN